MKNKSLGIYNLIDTDGINRSIKNVINNKINFNTYTSPKGLKELRVKISDWLNESWRINLSYKELLITSGSQQSINLIAYSLLNKGDTILIEQPTYFGAIDIFKKLDVNLVGVNLNDNGIDLEELEIKLNKYKPLLEDCKQQFHCDAELLIIIVSSLGAVPKETIDDVKKIAPSDRAWKKIVMKMVMTSIRESMFIYLKWHPNAQNPATPVHVSNSVTITEQDDVEEDDDQLEVDHSMNAIDDSAWKELIDDSPSNSSSSSNVQSSEIGRAHV